MQMAGPGCTNYEIVHNYEENGYEMASVRYDTCINES